MRAGNIFQEIKAACPPHNYDLTTAEGRADWDDKLREKISELAGDDSGLSRNAAALVKLWRHDEIQAVNREMFRFAGEPK